MEEYCTAGQATYCTAGQATYCTAGQATYCTAGQATYCTAGQATYENMKRYMRLPCWTNKATDRHSEYEILIAFPLQQWLHERASMSRYTYIACIVYNNNSYFAFNTTYIFVGMWSVTRQTMGVK